MSTWLKSGLLLAVIMTAVFSLLPEDFSNLAYMPWFMAILILPPYFSFFILCLVFGIDPISNYHSSEIVRPILVPAVWLLSVFVSYFGIGALMGSLAALVAKKCSSKRINV